MVLKFKDKYDFCHYVSHPTLPVGMYIPNIVIMYIFTGINLRIFLKVNITRYVGANITIFFNVVKRGLFIVLNKTKIANIYL